MTVEANLIAPCGMNCALCYAYQRHSKPCGGCREGGSNLPAHWPQMRRPNLHGAAGRGALLRELRAVSLQKAEPAGQAVPDKLRREPRGKPEGY